MDEGQERVQGDLPRHYDRLARVKTQYDPDNGFRVNENIDPAVGAWVARRSCRGVTGQSIRLTP